MPFKIQQIVVVFFVSLMVGQLSLCALVPSDTEYSNMLMVDPEDTSEKEENKQSEELKSKLDVAISDVLKRRSKLSQRSMYGMRYEGAMHALLVSIDVATPPPETGQS